MAKVWEYWWIAEAHVISYKNHYLRNGDARRRKCKIFGSTSVPENFLFAMKFVEELRFFAKEPKLKRTYLYYSWKEQMSC